MRPGAALPSRPTDPMRSPFRLKLDHPRHLEAASWSFALPHQPKGLTLDRRYRCAVARRTYRRRACIRLLQSRLAGFRTNGTGPTVKPSRSLRSAVDAHCRRCIYDPFAEGTWRKQVADCTGPDCPLFEFRARPLRSRQDALRVPVRSSPASRQTGASGASPAQVRCRSHGSAESAPSDILA